MRTPRKRAPTTPGEILLEEFLEPLGISQSELARRIGVSFPRVNEIVHGKRQVTTETALRLAKLFGTSATFWLNLQTACDLWAAEHSEEEQRALSAIEPARELEHA